MVFVLLTLKRHRDGLWVSRLVEQLEPLLEKESTVEDGGTVDDTASKLKVVALEDWLRGPANIDDLFGDCCAIINRVSDAAEPHLFKATVGLLQAAKLRQIPLFNGPNAYSLCGNKWCQHLLFDQVGISVHPRSSCLNRTLRLSGRLIGRSRMIGMVHPHPHSPPSVS